jgi:hypothetical protein
VVTYFEIMVSEHADAVEAPERTLQILAEASANGAAEKSSTRRQQLLRIARW